MEIRGRSPLYLLWLILGPVVFTHSQVHLSCRFCFITPPGNSWMVFIRQRTNVLSIWHLSQPDGPLLTAQVSVLPFRHRPPRRRRRRRNRVHPAPYQNHARPARPLFHPSSRHRPVTIRGTSKSAWTSLSPLTPDHLEIKARRSTGSQAGLCGYRQ